ARTVDHENGAAGPSQSVQIAAFEASPVAQVIVDHAGHMSAANMQARMLYGLAAADIGALLQDLELSYRPVELRSRIEQAYTEGHSVTLRDVEWHAGAEIRFLDVVVHPLKSTVGDGLGVAIAFSDVTRYRRLGEALQESKREAEIAYEELQSTVEELETTNEELQSTNEELETTNEELQSTNEELETMNEELQSTNEELETMNDKLSERTSELHTVNSSLETILTTLQVAVALVDPGQVVRVWNSQAVELWRIR